MFFFNDTSVPVALALPQTLEYHLPAAEVCCCGGRAIYGCKLPSCPDNFQTRGDIYAGCLPLPGHLVFVLLSFRICNSQLLTMSQLPSFTDLSLTTNMDSSLPQLRSTASKAAQPDGGRDLPGLREIVGAAYSSQRPLLPQPPPTVGVPDFFIPGVSILYLDGAPIKTYSIGGSKYNMTQPPNETKSEHSRYTIDLRRITYSLEVVQQPEKARACGSGPRCKCFPPAFGSLLTSSSQHLRIAGRSIRLRLLSSEYSIMMLISPWSTMPRLCCMRAWKSLVRLHQARCTLHQPFPS